MKKIIGLMIGLGLAFAASAEVIVGYSIDDTALLSADTLAEDVASTDLTSPAWTLAVANDDFINIAESSGMADGMDDDMDGAFASGQYIEFTISTTSLDSFDLDELQMTLQRSSNGPQDYGVRISTDGFAAGNSDTGFFELYVTDDSIGQTATLETVSLSGITFDSSSDLTFRIAYDDRVANNSGSSAGRFYDIAVTSIPEPATIGMLGLGTVGLLTFRRRMRG